MECGVLVFVEGIRPERGWSSGESARLRPTNVSGDYRIPGPGVICALSLLLVLYSVSRGFSPGSPVFSLSLKQNSISKFQFDPGMHGYLWTSSLSSLVLRGWTKFTITMTFYRRPRSKNLLSNERTDNKLNLHMARGRNRTKATLVGGERSDNCGISVLRPPTTPPPKKPSLIIAS